MLTYSLGALTFCMDTGDGAAEVVQLANAYPHCLGGHGLELRPAGRRGL